MFCSGLDTLQVAVTYWEDAVMKMGYLDDNPLPAITVSIITLSLMNIHARLCPL